MTTRPPEHPFRYVVRASFAEDGELVHRWVAWLVEEHLDDVLASGAVAAEIVRLDGQPPVLEVHYEFADRDAFERYETEHAPRLRAEGLREFPPGNGLEMQRRTGEALHRAP